MTTRGRLQYSFLVIAALLLVGAIIAWMIIARDDTPETPTHGTSGIGTDAGSYEAYTEDKLVRAEHGDIVLFFYASWCPSCRMLEETLFEQAAQIPSNLSVLKVDYDTDTALKEKYAVTLQHTLVQVDASGNAMTTWKDSETLEDILAHLK